MMSSADDHAIAWDERGLAPVIVQDARTGAVRMLAWMNAEALHATRATGLVTLYSRSRGALWQKGETSGNTLGVRDIRVDCDRDAILVIAEPAGPTCHTGATSCFHRVLDRDSGALLSPDDGPTLALPDTRGADAGADADAPERVLARLEEVLVARRDGAPQKSYTRSLLERGMPRILEKIAEEHAELAAELPAGSADDVVHEAADLMFHVLVGLVARRVPIAGVWRELERRFGVSGHDEKASRGASREDS